MSRLPIPGQDDDVWGQILNDFLGVSNNPDGTIQTSAIAASGGYIKPNGGIPSTDLSSSTQSSLTTANSSVQSVNSRTPSSGNVTIGLANLTDASISSPTNNQILAYDNSSSKWINQTPGSGVGLDSNATDIQPLGTRAAGSTGLAADASHVHTMPRLDQISNPTASVSLNSNKITNLANGTLATDAVAFGQVPTAGSGASNFTAGNATLGGDLSGTLPDPTVSKVGGKTVTIAGEINLADYGNPSAAGTAINAAIAALGANGGTIIVPAGTWTIDEQILITQSGITIQGVGAASNIAFNGGTVPTMLAMADTTQRHFTMCNLRILQTGTQGTGTAIDASYFVNSVFQELRIGDGQNPNQGIIFNAIGSYYNVIRDCRISVNGVSSKCISFNNTSNSNIVENCRIFGDSNTTGVYVNSNGIILNRIDMETNGLIGIHLDTNANNCSMINPYLELLVTGIQLESGAGPVSLLNGDVGGCTNPITDNGAVGFSWENTWAWSTSLPNTSFSSSSTSTQLWGVKESADTNPRISINSAGTMSFGPGNVVSDVTFNRSSAQTLEITGSLNITLNNRVEGNQTIGKLTTIGSGGAGVLEIAANVAPTANPTGGASVYYSGGVLKYLDPSGNTWLLNSLNSSGELAATTLNISGTSTLNGLVTAEGGIASSGGQLTATDSGSNAVVLATTTSGSGSNSQPVFGAISVDTGNRAFAALVSGDANNRWAVFADGTTQWGIGSAIRDTELQRTAAGALTLSPLSSAPYSEFISQALSSSGLTGATAASRYVGGTSSGAPVSGTFAIGDYIIDQSGKIWICTIAGSPGTWTTTSASSATSLIPGLVQLDGDLSGTATSPTVAKVNGVSISGTPSMGQSIVASSSSTASWSNIAGTEDWLNVKTQYGAAGDGSTDDTSAIQNALNAANTAGGGTVYFPAGTYIISSAITTYTGVVLQGGGPDTSVIKQTSTTANAIYALTQRYMAIRDLQILGPNSGSGTGIYLDTSGAAVANCQFSNLLIQKFGTDGMYVNTPIASSFDTVRSQNNDQHGFHFSNGTSISMAACYGAGNTDAGYYFNTMTYCSLSGCAADSNGTGYWLTSGGNITLTGCGCEAAVKSNATYNGYGYVANGGTEFTFIGCYSTGNPTIAYWFTASTTLGLVQACREANPVGGATASIQVDSGCTATVIFPSTVTSPNYVGNTNFFNFNGVQTYGTGTASIRASRGATSNFGSIVLSTAAVDEWGVQMMNDSTNDVHLRDVLDAHDMIIGEQHSAVPNMQLLSDTKSFGNGVGVIGIGNANAVPNTNPTGGIILYVDNGVLKWRDTSGNIYELNIQTTGGALAVSSGGTGATTLTGLVVGNGTSPLSSVTAPVGTVVGTSDTMTLSNKRITRRVVPVTQSATPAIDTDNTDVASITGLAQAITSMTSSLTGTPIDGDTLIVRITDNGGPQSITWGTSFEASTVALPTTTVASIMLMTGFMWNTATSKWRCIAVA